MNRWRMVRLIALRHGLIGDVRLWLLSRVSMRLLILRRPIVSWPLVGRAGAWRRDVVAGALSVG